jgi:hypothetical protein
MPRVLGYAAAFIFVAGALLVLGAILRFSVLSQWRLRGSRQLLRSPDLDSVQRICGFTIPLALDRMYREASFIDKSEFELVDTSASPPTAWTIGAFNALTPPAVREWRSISGVPGVPLADDLDKGVYFVSASGSVMLASPNVDGGKVLVAPSVEEFAMFEAREFPESDA